MKHGEMHSNYIGIMRWHVGIAPKEEAAIDQKESVGALRAALQGRIAICCCWGHIAELIYMVFGAMAGATLNVLVCITHSNHRVVAKATQLDCSSWSCTLDSNQGITCLSLGVLESLRAWASWLVFWCTHNIRSSPPSDKLDFSTDEEQFKLIKVY